ncbi:MAG: TIGR03808 family TAT-translocated repetitive protein [Pseudomonadota bacterium]
MTKASSTNISRRAFLGTALAGACAPLTVARPARAQSSELLASLRSTLDITTYGVRPGALDNQSVRFQEAVNAAARQGNALFVPGGDYMVSNIDLPSNLTMVGVPGQTRIRYAGDGHLFFGTAVNHLRLEGITLDGANRPLADYAPALLHVSTGANIALENVTVVGSVKHGIQFDRVQGSIDRCTVTGVLAAAIQSHDAQGLAIRDNVVSDCADNGILVYRWNKGRDGTIVTGNRIERIRSKSGGTGPFGNAINAYQADDVLIANNMIYDNDFSAVRCNGCSNAQILGNQCGESGEAAIWSEFDFRGSIVANNVMDGCASGIVVTNFMQGGRLAIVQGNLIRNMRMQSKFPTGEEAYGSGIYVEADTTVTGNVIENAPYAGLRVGWGPYLRNVIISQNIIRKAQIGMRVSVVEGVEMTVIKDNIFDETPGGAIVGTRWWETVTSDLIDERRLPTPLTIEGNQVLS